MNNIIDRCYRSVFIKEGHLKAVYERNEPCDGCSLITYENRTPVHPDLTEAMLGFVVYDFLVSKGAIADSQQDLDEMLKHADRRPMELRRRGECGRINVKEYVDSPNIWAKQELLKRYFQQLQMEGAEEIPPVT